jgi:general stress protein 26
MALSHTTKHDTVSIYPFSEEEVEKLMTNANEAVLMWSTKDGWPVGVTHSFVWRDGKIWLTFTAQRHRAAAIRRDNRVSVNVSSRSYAEGADPSLPSGAITFKGHGEFHEDQATKDWFYKALAKKVSPTNAEFEAYFNNLLESPLRVILEVTPVKKIMYNAGLAERHMIEGVEESELGAPLESDTKRIAKERERRGIS